MEGLERGGCFQKNPQEELLFAFQYRKLKVFDGTLNSDDVDLSFEYSAKGLILEIVCSSPGNNADFIKCLIEHGVDPNTINESTSKGPIHSLASANKADSLSLLLEYDKTDINLKDELGKTALHYAMENESADCLQKLLQYRHLDVNFPDTQDRTPIHCAIDADRKKNIQLLLESFREGLDLDSVRDCHSDLTPREAIQNKYSDIDLPEPKPKRENIFQILRNSEPHEMEFSQFSRTEIESNDGHHTPLQYAADYGFTSAVQNLLQLGANPQTTHQANKNTPLMIAASKGYVTIVKMLCSDGRTEVDDLNESTHETVLHKVVKGSGGRPTLGASKDDIDHVGCLKIILNYGKECSGFRIDHQDINGNTALMCAALQGSDAMCLILLQYGSFACITNKRGDAAISLISPTVLEEFFDGCISPNDCLPREDNYELIFDYNFVVPRSRPEQFSESHLPMMIATSKDTKHLLKHPVFKLFLQLKWEKIKNIFMINFIVYSIFCFVFTLYVLNVLKSKGSTEEVPTTETPVSPPERAAFSTFSFVILILTVILTIRELFQFIISPLKYIKNLDNWIEATLFFVTYILIFTSSEQLARVCSAVGIILSWTELLLLIGRHPVLSTYIEMLKSVSVSFIKFLAWYSILIFGFSLSFCILFHDAETNEEEPNFFVTPGLAFFKSIVMLTGEFETNSVPFDQYNGLSHVTFLLFVFLISIVLFNLLTGLAVSDTQMIKDEAELVGYISEVKLISYYEDFLKNDSPVMRLVLRLQRAFCTFRQRNSRVAFERNLSLFVKDDDLTVRIWPNKENVIRLFGKRVESTSRIPEYLYFNLNVYAEALIVSEARQILRGRQTSSETEEPAYVQKMSARLDELAKQQQDLSKKVDLILDYIQRKR